MQVVKIQGGLGNQMFQYAFGYALHHKYKVKVYYDLSLYDIQKETNQYTQREFLLSKAYHISICKYNRNSLKNKIIQKCYKWLGVTRHIIHDAESGYQPIDFKKNTTYIGYWQDQEYFKEYHQKLVKLFTPSKFSTSCLQWQQLIQSSEIPTVSVHFRRGDYVQKEAVNAVHGVCSNQYYLDALQYLMDRIPTFQIFVFSDDINWVKENFMFQQPAFFVDNVTVPWEDIYLQSICNHNIIANSSFSWWGAWLNKNPNKINIGPLKWFNDIEKNNNFKNILPNYFIKI
ncbi:MAG: alpha-1,2-fucosyltransferase [Flavobacterium sp.]